MPYPQEYQIATIKFQDFLIDVRNNGYFVSSNMVYTMTQGVFQVFRRRLSLKDAILFSNILPTGIRALFVADWNPDEDQKAFESREIMIKEVKQLRSQHNFSSETKDPIWDVAKALRNQVDEKALDDRLQSFPEGAFEFWRV